MAWGKGGERGDVLSVCPGESPLLAAIIDNFVVRNSPLAGIDAPTLARIGTGRPKGRSHFSFGGERKVCKRKPAARRLREKALYCPFWRRGSLCRAQRSWPATPAIVRARSSPFSAVKMGGPFSLRCLSPLCSPAVGVGQAYPLAGWDVFLWLRYFCSTTGQREFDFTLAFVASHEACRRMAVFAMQLAGGEHQTREPWHPSCHGGNPPAKPHVPRAAPRPMARSGVQGYYPCPQGLSPSGGKNRPTGMPTSSPAPYGRGVGSRGTAPCDYSC